MIINVIDLSVLLFRFFLHLEINSQYISESCDDIDEAQQILCEFKEAHTLDGWLGNEGDELVIVAFSNKKIPNFPTFFKHFESFYERTMTMTNVSKECRD